MPEDVLTSRQEVAMRGVEAIMKEIEKSKRAKL